MKKSFLLKTMLLLCALVAGSGSVWAAENDTHDFSQTLSQLLNNGADIASINIAEQSYTVKEVIISYTHNKSLTGDFVTASVSVGGNSFGSTMLTANTTTTQSFSSSSKSGAIVISFTNPRTGTGQGTFKVTNVCLVEGTASTQVAQPTFSPDGGAVEAGTKVTINSLTDGATIYYTMGAAPADPTTSSTLYDGPITINEATTIKAIAVKDGMTNSSIGSASYTIKDVVHGYAIDFEKPIDAYVDWTITNIGIHTSGLTAAHSGSAWGSNVNESDNGVGTASIQTKEKVANPGVFTCYISKESSNTSSSTWKIQVSSNGSDWTDIASLSSMTQNTWKTLTGNIAAAGYTNVYVRLYYNGSTAKRAVDDIMLTEAAVFAAGKTMISYSNKYCALDFTDANRPTGLKAYKVSAADGSSVTLTEVTSTVAANTGLILTGSESTSYAIKPVTSGTDISATNKLVATDGKSTVSDAAVLKDGKFHPLNSGVIAAGKAYLPYANIEGGDPFAGGAPALDIVFGGETTGIESVKGAEFITNGEFYNLNGQRVAQPTKGLYIVNGKKVIIK